MSIDALLAVLKVVGAVLGVLITLGSLGAGVFKVYSVIRDSGRKEAERQASEMHAKDQTRLTINELKPMMAENLAETKEQSKTLEVLKYQGNQHSEELRDIKAKLDDHGTRITRLEAKEIP
jgi:ferritin-like metal-binding protein YciE